MDVHKWLTFPQLIHFYSVGQMAPGPNIIKGLDTAIISVGVLLILLRYEINPAHLVLAGAVVGVLSFMPK